MDPSSGGASTLRETPPPQDPPVQATPTTRATTDGPPDGFRNSSDAKKELKPEMRACTSTQGPESLWAEDLYATRGINDSIVEELLNHRVLKGEYSGGRWKSIPLDPESEDRRFYDGLVRILNKIIQAAKPSLKGHGHRRAIVTAFKQQDHEEVHRPFGPAPPDLAKAYSMPDILIVGQDDRLLPHPIPNGNNVSSEEFPHAIVVGDVKLDSNTRRKAPASGPNDEDTKAQVIGYARYVADFH